MLFRSCFQRYNVIILLFSRKGPHKFAASARLNRLIRALKARMSLPIQGREGRIRVCV